MSGQTGHVQTVEQYSFFQHQNHPRAPAARGWFEKSIMFQLKQGSLTTYSNLFNWSINIDWYSTVYLNQSSLLVNFPYIICAPIYWILKIIPYGFTMENLKLILQLYLFTTGETEMHPFVFTVFKMLSLYLSVFFLSMQWPTEHLSSNFNTRDCT